MLTSGDSNQKQGVSVILPAFNEEEAVAAQIEVIEEEMVAIGRPFEILLIDDGSEDATAERASVAGARLISHRENIGYGAAIKTGVNSARFETIVMIDADGTYPAQAISPILDELKDADMVVGARTGAEVHVPLVRRPAKWVLQWLATRITGRSIPDLNSGLRAFYRTDFQRYYPILPDRFSLTTTSTLAYLADGYDLIYYPINYYTRVGKSKITPWHFMDFTFLVLRMAILFQPLKVFVPLAFTSGFLGVSKVILDVMAFFVRNPTFRWALLYEAVVSTSALLLILIAVQLLLIGMVADGVIRRIGLNENVVLRSLNNGNPIAKRYRSENSSD